MVKNVLGILSLGFLILFPLSASDFPETRVLPSDFPEFSMESGSMYSSPVKGFREFRVSPDDGTLEYQVTTSAYTFTYTTDNLFNLISAHGQYHDQGFVEATGFQEVDIKRNGKGQLVFKGLKKNGRVREKYLPLRDSVVYGDSATFFFQSLLLSNNGQIENGRVSTLFIPFPPVWVVYSMSRFKSSLIPQMVPQYDIPEAFNPFIVEDRDLLVVETAMDGIAGSFFPHKFYFAYATEAPYPMVAMWGGQKGKNDYFIFYN